MPSLPNQPGFHLIEVAPHLDQLFSYDTAIFDDKPILFPFETKDQLLNYLTEEHTTQTYIFNNDEGEFVGYFSYEEECDLPHMVELINLGILPKFQRQGFGSIMMEKYLSFVGDRHSRHVTHPDNSSKFLYEKYGYVRVKIIKNYFGDGEPRVIYFRKGQ